MPMARSMLVALSVAVTAPTWPGVAQAEAGYCRLPDHSATSGANPIDTASSLGWIHPLPPPADRDPTESERLDFAGFPNVSAIDVLKHDGAPRQKLITTFTTNVDEIVTLTNAAAISDDGGLTFGPASRTPLREAPIELLDGRYFATEYYLRRTGPHPARLGVLTSRSPDDQESWERSEPTLFTPGDLLPGGAAHGVPIQLADGTILITVYARYRDTGTYQAEVYASHDGARTFERRGVIAGPSERFVYNEAAVEQTMDGSLLDLAAMHRLTRIGLSLRPGHAAGARVYVSADGRSWGEPVVTITGRTDYALRYSELARTGRHVKIVTDPTSGCEPEIGRTCSMLNEVELYS
ncbi:sialidase family protein [Nonomuraea sp. B19D2]|uniref:sialidase family protein n=1 Tax=Nonomuraea sp. B19D2 TaxID=3159561 RepID=UPI0032D9B2B2